jgi:predicted DNA-binding transcriptional regulator AlpA
VNVTTPELAGDRSISATELAAIGGIAPSTLRAYISRGEEQVPSPQAVIGGRRAWSRPVAEEWVEQRRRDNVAETVAINHGGADMHPGTAEVCHRFERIFYSALWENPVGASGGHCGGVTKPPSGTSPPGWLGTSPLTSPHPATAESFLPGSGRHDPACHPRRFR